MLKSCMPALFTDLCDRTVRDSVPQKMHVVPLPRFLILQIFIVPLVTLVFAYRNIVEWRFGWPFDLVTYSTIVYVQVRSDYNFRAIAPFTRFVAALSVSVTIGVASFLLFSPLHAFDDAVLIHFPYVIFAAALSPVLPHFPGTRNIVESTIVLQFLFLLYMLEEALRSNSSLFQRDLIPYGTLLVEAECVSSWWAYASSRIFITTVFRSFVYIYIVKMFFVASTVQPFDKQSGKKNHDIGKKGKVDVNMKGSHRSSLNYLTGVRSTIITRDPLISPASRQVNGPSGSLSATLESFAFRILYFTVVTSLYLHSLYRSIWSVSFSRVDGNTWILGLRSLLQSFWYHLTVKHETELRVTLGYWILFFTFPFVYEYALNLLASYLHVQRFDPRINALARKNYHILILVIWTTGRKVQPLYIASCALIVTGFAILEGLRGIFPLQKARSERCSHTGRSTPPNCSVDSIISENSNACDGFAESEWVVWPFRAGASVCVWVIRTLRCGGHALGFLRPSFLIRIYFVYSDRFVKDRVKLVELSHIFLLLSASLFPALGQTLKKCYLNNSPADFTFRTTIPGSYSCIGFYRCSVSYLREYTRRICGWLGLYQSSVPACASSNALEALFEHAGIVTVVLADMLACTIPIIFSICTGKALTRLSSITSIKSWRRPRAAFGKMISLKHPSEGLTEHANESRKKYVTQQQGQITQSMYLHQKLVPCQPESVLIFGNRTVLGSVACFVTVLFCSQRIVHLPLAPSTFAAGSATLIEAISPLDNLLLPLVYSASVLLITPVAGSPKK